MVCFPLAALPQQLLQMGSQRAPCQGSPSCLSALRPGCLQVTSQWVSPSPEQNSLPSPSTAGSRLKCLRQVPRPWHVGPSASSAACHSPVPQARLAPLTALHFSAGAPLPGTRGAKCFHGSGLVYSSQRVWEASVMPSSQVRQLRLRGIKQFASGQAVSRWQARRGLGPELMSLQPPHQELPARASWLPWLEGTRLPRHSQCSVCVHSFT